jgi:perosamine synthetase
MGDRVDKIQIAKPSLSGNERKYLLDAFDSGYVSSIGAYVGAFEKAFAKYLNVPFSESVSNGTVALHLAYSALGLKVGDEIIMPVTSFIATANAAHHMGVKPVFVDISEENWCIDENLIEEKITKNTKAIVVVHLYGNAAAMDKIMSIANQYNLPVIEDCAEAVGAKFNGRLVGTFGSIATFSFFGNKIITTGEGGMVTTTDPILAEKIKILKNHGQDPSVRYFYPVAGFNYRMTNLQAAIGLAQLERINDFIAERIRVCDFYDHHLAQLGFSLQPKPKNSAFSPWMYSALLPNSPESTSISLMNYLADKGVETRPLFRPMSEMPPYIEHSVFPVASAISKLGFSLPTRVDLLNEQLTYIVNAISNFCSL